MQRVLQCRWILSMLVVLIASGVLIAQTGNAALGRIEGTVKDSIGGALPGVSIRLTGTPLERPRSAISDGEGRYVFVDVPAGAYEIAFELTGFTPTKMSISLGAGERKVANADLKIGGLGETLTVTGASAVVDVQSATRQTYMSVNGQRSADNLSVQQWEMAQMIPGVSLTPGTPGTETYDKVAENDWKSVDKAPLSTFSIDVDTAAYANVRRFLNLGQLPPRDSVRIEELINYFSYNYPEPRGREPFTVTTAVDVAPWNPEHKLALIGLQARRLDARSTPPRNLVFLIDVSGSMDMPHKLPLVQASLALLARNLTDRDRIAIVVYAGAAGLVLPATRGSDTTTILEAIGRLHAGGSTNGAGGIALAYRVAGEQFIKGGVNRVVLATDGDFNVGITNKDALIELIEEKRKSGIALSVLGFGMGNLKDATMERLADAGNGNYSYIDSLTEARKVLVEEAGGTLVTVAKDVKLQIEFNPAVVGAYRLIGYENRMLKDRDFNDDTKDAGEIGAGHSVTALYEIVPVGGTVGGVDALKYQPTPSRVVAAPSAAAEMMTIKLRYKEPDGDVSTKTEVVVANRSNPSDALRFAAAVAEFGLLLRNSEFKGTASFRHAHDSAEAATSADRFGHRAEFVRLIDAAAALSDLARASR